LCFGIDEQKRTGKLSCASWSRYCVPQTTLDRIPYCCNRFVAKVLGFSDRTYPVTPLFLLPSIAEALKSPVANPSERKTPAQISSNARQFGTRTCGSGNQRNSTVVLRHFQKEIPSA
jgi:hypothetical protein